MLTHSKLFTESPAKQRLPIHEWVAVVFIISIFILLTLISLINSEKPLQETDFVSYSQPLIEITIEGAVKYPGVYQVEKGTPIIDAINQAEPYPTADLKKLKTDSQATRKRKIVIKERIGRLD